MRLLLDTHVFIWFVLSPDQLSPLALAAIRNAENTIYLSLVSAWEMSIKSGLGKLTLTQPIEAFGTRHGATDSRSFRSRSSTLPPWKRCPSTTVTRSTGC